MKLLRQRVEDFAKERMAEFSKANLPKTERKDAYKNCMKI
jgi:hypothetical protein